MHIWVSKINIVCTTFVYLLNSLYIIIVLSDYYYEYTFNVIKLKYTNQLKSLIVVTTVGFEFFSNILMRI